MSQDPASRRILLAGVATGAVVAVGTRLASAQTPTQTASAPKESKMGLINPVTEYPQPPFPKQKQPWPGLAREMQPVPDHGEKSYRGSGRLAGRKALITGGDSGMGRAAAIAFAREGADVAIGYLPEEEPDARDVVRLIEAEGRKAVTVPGDISDQAFCRQLVDRTVQGLGGLDILVNNAARQFARPSIREIRPEDFDMTFKINVYAPFWITQAALPHLKPGATIINTVSVNSYEPGETMIDYAATKGALMILTKGLAKQLAKDGIRVNAVAPGPVWTPLQVTGGQLDEDLPKFGENTPLGRPGQPAELAGLYVLLASPESSFSTGQVFAAVGGRGGP